MTSKISRALVYEAEQIVEEPYSILEHPADLGIEARGKTLGETFQNAARGLISVIVDPSTVRPTESRGIRLSAADREQLLVKWLSEVLYLYDGGKFVSGEFLINEIREDYIEATVVGEMFSEERHTTRIDVKAVTYHQLSIEENDHTVVARVYLDI